MEFEGTTEQDAVQKACSALNLDRNDLDYTVIDEGSGGLFGLGSRPVRIRARTPSSNAMPVTSSRGVRENVETKMSSQVEATAAADMDDDEGPGGVVGPAPEKAARALEVAKGLAEKMEMPAEISVRDEADKI